MNETAKPFPPLRARFAHFRKKDKSRDFPLQPTGNFAIINRKSKGGCVMLFRSVVSVITAPSFLFLHDNHGSGCFFFAQKRVCNEMKGEIT